MSARVPQTQFVNQPRLGSEAETDDPMDTSALMSAAVMAQAGALQQNIATSVMKQNIDAEKSVLKLLEPAALGTSSANLAPGVGGNLDISA